MTTRKKLCTIKGISEAKMEKIKEACGKIAGVCDITLILSIMKLSITLICS